jgi:hypothetical protein
MGLYGQEKKGLAPSAPLCVDARANLKINRELNETARKKNLASAISAPLYMSSGQGRAARDFSYWSKMHPSLYEDVLLEIFLLIPPWHRIL